MTEEAANMSNVTDQRDAGGFKLTGNAVVYALLVASGLAVGGGTGTVLQGSATSSTLREVRAEIMGGLRTIESKLDDHTRRLSEVEKRLREHEQLPAHDAALVTMKAIEERVKRLEGR